MYSLLNHPLFDWMSCVSTIMDHHDVWSYYIMMMIVLSSLQERKKSIYKADYSVTNAHYYLINILNMSSPSKTSAKKDQFVGNVKDTVGDVTGNESLQARGKTQNASGHTEETASNIQGYVQGAIDQVTGTVKGAVNALTGNSSEEASAKVQKNKGEAQKEWNS
jgi:uncharacterized protein YjbJ (UPF0337 family)